MKEIIRSADATVTLETGMLGGDPKITVACRNFTPPPMTPQQFVDWIYAYINLEAQPLDSK